MSFLQMLVALSRGDAEHHGACTGYGMQPHHQDWMVDVSIKTYSDSPSLGFFFFPVIRVCSCVACAPVFFLLEVFSKRRES